MLEYNEEESKPSGGWGKLLFARVCLAMVQDNMT